MRLRSLESLARLLRALVSMSEVLARGWEVWEYLSEGLLSRMEPLARPAEVMSGW